MAKPILIVRNNFEDSGTTPTEFSDRLKHVLNDEYHIVIIEDMESEYRFEVHGVSEQIIKLPSI